MSHRSHNRHNGKFLRSLYLQEIPNIVHSTIPLIEDVNKNSWLLRLLQDRHDFFNNFISSFSEPSLRIARSNCFSSGLESTKISGTSMGIYKYLYLIHFSSTLSTFSAKVESAKERRRLIAPVPASSGMCHDPIFRQRVVDHDPIFSCQTRSCTDDVDDRDVSTICFRNPVDGAQFSNIICCY